MSAISDEYRYQEKTVRKIDQELESIRTKNKIIRIISDYSAELSLDLLKRTMHLLGLKYPYSEKDVEFVKHMKLYLLKYKDDYEEEGYAVEALTLMIEEIISCENDDLLGDLLYTLG